MGSGLGASSILGAAILRGIRTLCGQELGTLAPSSVALEWRTGSRGGWQDAMGGMLGGLKRICAQPGEGPVVETLTPSAGFLSQLRARTVLFCAGVPRREGILDHVMTGYLVRDPTVYPAILEGRRLTERLSRALTEENLESFGTLLGDYWKAWIRHAGPGAVTDTTRAVLEAARPFTLGAKVSGVGVFYLFIARPGMAESLRATLSGFASGELYDFELDGEGARTRER
jgi:galactokinase/mevalonate kinase-like predicted kinase